MTTGMKQLMAKSVFVEVSDELARARSSYPNFHSSHEGHSILREELDELWDLVKADKSQKPSRWFIDRHGRHRLYRDCMRAECIQIAAMAIRFIEDLCDEPPSVGAGGEGDNG